MTDDGTGLRFRLARQAIGWSIRQTADMIGINERNLRLIEDGARNMPQELLDWIERLASFHEGNPPPFIARRKKTAHRR